MKIRNIIMKSKQSKNNRITQRSIKELLLPLVRLFFRPGVPMIFLAFLAISCSNSKQDSGSFTVLGKFANCTGEKIRIEEMGINAIIPLDSANIDQAGEIRLSCKADQAGFYLLRFPDKKKIILLLDKGENLEISGDCQNLSANLVMKGSPGSMLLADFFRETNRNRKTIDSLKMLLKGHEGSPDFLKISGDADAGFQKITEDQRKLELEFIHKNPNSLACLIVLNFSFGPQPILDIDHDFDVYQRVDSALQRICPQNKHLVYHHKRVEEKKRQESVKKL